MHIRRMLGFLSVLVLVVAACGDDDTGDVTTTTGGGSTAVLTITDPWARTSANMQNAGAAYMVISGGAADDALVGVSVPASVAATAELHETVMAGDNGSPGMGSGTGSTMGGAMTMQAVDSIAVPAGGSVTLEPGGYHVMLMDLAEPLVAGATFEVTLQFQNAGERVVQVEVRDS